MRAPNWLKNLIAEEGAKILAKEITDAGAVHTLRATILAKDDGAFGHAIIDDYVGRQVKIWTARHRVGPALGEDDSGQTELFADIPRTLEIAPGRFVHQAMMTRRDWVAAVRQAETKASNAGGYAEAIKRIADKVLPLLTNDDQTTAEVWKPGRAAEGGS